MKQRSYTFKKLNFLYTVHDKFTAGVMLEGWEVASLKTNGCILDAAYCIFIDNDFVLHNSKITPMKNHMVQNKNVTDKEAQNRRLLLNKKELNKIRERLEIKGHTVVPSKLFYNQDGKWKLEIAVVTGKKLYDKRASLKEKDLERERRRES